MGKLYSALNAKRRPAYMFARSLKPSQKLPEGNTFIEQRNVFIHKLIKMRMLVGFLGEKAQSAWWPTVFFDSASKSFLEPTFPKTLRLARYHAVTEAARRVHDENLSVGSFHLFRLPEETEQDLHQIVLTSEAELFDAIQQDAMSELKDLAGEKANEDIGPVQVGSISELANKAEAIAAAYVSALESGKRVYPYLV